MYPLMHKALHGSQRAVVQQQVWQRIHQLAILKICMHATMTGKLLLKLLLCILLLGCNKANGFQPSVRQCLYFSNMGSMQNLEDAELLQHTVAAQADTHMQLQCMGPCREALLLRDPPSWALATPCLD